MGLVEIDGSVLEGGGQILRTALALSAITGVGIRIFNIRARRSNPGLQQQHLTSVLAAARIARAEVVGAVKGSTELTFKPGGITCGDFRFDIGTAGSVTLVIQTILPILTFAPCPSTVTITGGTDVPWSPPIDYVRFVMLPTLSLFGVNAEVKLLRRGHYPRGGGEVRLTVRPNPELRPVNAVEFGDLVEVRGLSHAVRLPRHVAERQAKSAREHLIKGGVKAPINIELEYYEQGNDPHLGPGSGIVLWAVSSRNLVKGGDALGERGKPAEAVGEEAAKKLLENLSVNMALDDHMGDMVIPYMALARGRSTIGVSRITLHTLTNIYIVERILGVKFNVKGEEGKPGIIEFPGH
ncbi:RNA 3'-terminal phosphate cyclase [Vulcanisaeta thermophila]|uniref:RNA 3'-terminal phosphate cyclase n=1 Tax=Vulcanisaeta thermophila TaxID=867917 RepID=UPI000853C6D9|nr:RNA 3'-terminal phosphate cyclase [Vulcanisaeta thermophila]